ncbi:hypothetical protein JCM10213_003906 [Rhodosporidiobolus nylandii]
MRSVGSGHRVSPGSVHFFPLVKEPKARNKPPTASSVEVLGSTAPLSPSGSTAAPDQPASPTKQPPRSGSVSSTSSAAPRAAVFPTITPNRAAGAAVGGSSVFPTVGRPSLPRQLSDASIRSGSTLSRHGPSPSISSPSSASPPASSYAPSIAPSTRSGRTERSGKYAPSVGSYAPSSSTSYATSDEQPLSIFLHPEGQKRPLSDLIPKKKFTSLFSRDKSKNTTTQAGSAGGPAYRGKSASVLDAALATSQSWANRRGEQQKAFAPQPSLSAFGPPAGYRPAHQLQRQREEAAARAAIGAGTGGPGQPLSADALALAGRESELRRAPSGDSARTIGSSAVGGGNAFPTRQPGQAVFATKQRPKPQGGGGTMVPVDSSAPASTGLGIS